VSNTPKAHDNSQVQAFLDGFCTVSELCREYPEMDDILSGVLALKTSGNTATRTLSRQVLFHLLQHCETITVASLNDATCERYAYNTLAGYSALARVASKAIAGCIDRHYQGHEQGMNLAEARRELDAPFDVQLVERILIFNLLKGPVDFEQCREACLP
jgi:hypothetical protein